MKKVALIGLVWTLGVGHGLAQTSDFYATKLDVMPPVAASYAPTYTLCPTSDGLAVNHLSSEQIDYSRPGWESRVAADWQAFGDNPANTRVTLIDIRQSQGKPVYRYFSDGRHDQLFEPWSASKVMSITAAMAEMTKFGLHGNSRVGNTTLSDIITSIHSYAPSGVLEGDSNGLATYLLNLAGRDAATALFHDDWLKLTNQSVRIRGAYGVTPYQPLPPRWQQGSLTAMPQVFQPSSADPGYQGYRCEECGLTGNKPMTTLAMAEWLKRLAVHQAEPTTRHPGLQQQDIHLLFYGDGKGQKGMSAGISRILHEALSQALSDSNAAQTVLDQQAGDWRIWQKIGWGPSETRQSGEVVLLAQVCLPNLNGGRAFTIAAQASVPEPTQASVARAGMNLAAAMQQSIRKWLTFD